MEVKIIAIIQDSTGRSLKTVDFVAAENAQPQVLLEEIKKRFPSILEKDKDYSVFIEWDKPLTNVFSSSESIRVVIREQVSSQKYALRLLGDPTIAALPPDVDKKKKGKGK